MFTVDVKQQNNNNNSELQLNKADVSDIKASFLDLHYLYQIVLLRLKFLINGMALMMIL